MIPRRLLDSVLIVFAVIALGVQCALGGIAYRLPEQERVDEPLIRQSAIAPVLLWFLAMLTNRRPKAVWLLGAIAFPIHVLIAFHLGHRWSLAAAMAHVERVSGFGPGLFVSFAFGIVWLIDALWLVMLSASYRRRPRWLNVLILGFLAFVVFNATVVYGGKTACDIGVGIFLMLLMQRVWNNRSRWDQ